MVNEETLQEIQDWFKSNKLSFDSEEFEALYSVNYGASCNIEIFAAEGSLSELLDYFSWTLKNEDLDAFFDSLEDLRVYASQDAFIEDFIDAYEIDDHVARYLDEERIIRDFLYGGGFQIGSLLCEGC